MNTRHGKRIALVVGCVVGVALGQPACGSADATRRVTHDDAPETGAGGKASGGSASTGGKATGGASGGTVSTGGTAGTAGTAGASPVEAGAGGGSIDASDDVSVPDDSGKPEAGTDGPIFIPTVDAGAGCEPPVGESPITPQSASLPAAGLVTWLRGDRGIYKTAANAVCAWVDQSGAGHVFTAGAPTARPTFTATGLGTRPGVDFGVSQPLGVDSALVFPSQSARTFVAVEKHVSLTSRFGILTGNYANNFNYLGIDCNTFHTKGGLEGVYMHGNAYDSDLGTTVDVRVHVYLIGPMVIGTPILPAIHYRVNGVERTLTRTPAGSGNGNFQDFSLAYRTVVGEETGGSMVGEFLVYDRLLSNDDVLAVEAALKTRYAIP